MTGLSSALTSALSGLLVTSGQSAVVSRNVSRAGEEDYTRKQLQLTSSMDGTARAASVTRNSQKTLLDSYLNSSSASTGQNAILSSLEQISVTVGDVEQDGSLAWSIGQMQQVLVNFEADPSNTNIASLVVRTASELARSLNGASTTVQNARADADANMAQSVSTVNSLLARLEETNIAITTNNGGNDAVLEAMDQRDGILKQLASEIGIRVVGRPNSGIAVYTDGGVPLFDVRAREVSMNPTTIYGGTTTGNAVYADGVQITGAGAQMPLASGKLLALAEFRDEIAPVYQSQLDEVARGLISMFAERDQSAVPVQPDATGLFSYTGSPAVPAAATVIPGLAGEITINAAYDPQQGGNAMLVRDGGANGAAYVYNASGAVGFQARISELAESFDGVMSFSPDAKLSANVTIKSFAANSSGWLEDLRANANAKSESAIALVTRSKDALLKQTGVNIDEEMAILLDLEKSYQASAKVLSTVNQMFSTLVDAVR